MTNSSQSHRRGRADHIGGMLGNHYDLARLEVTELRKNMRAERARNNLTIEQVADKLDVHPNAVRRWERGQAEPTASNLIALSKLYRCTPEYLLDMTADPNGVAVAGIA